MIILSRFLKLKQIIHIIAKNKFIEYQQKNKKMYSTNQQKM
jgi:hypothetical protein